MTGIPERIRKLQRLADRWQEEVDTAGDKTELTQRDVNLLRGRISRVAKRYAETLRTLSVLESEYIDSG